MSKLLDRIGHKLLAWMEMRRVAFFRAKMNIGDGVRIKPGLVVKCPGNIFLGNKVHINVNCLLQAHAPIYVGDMTMIAANCAVVTANHDSGLRGTDALNTVICQEVNIGSNCWLGAGVLVLPGVTIGDGVVVGAGSVVVKDLPPETVCIGSPAKPVKERPRKVQ